MSGYYINPDNWEIDENQIELYTRDYGKVKKCNHKWKPTELIFSTVFDCEICGIKKELSDEKV